MAFGSRSAYCQSFSFVDASLAVVCVAVRYLLYVDITVSSVVAICVFVCVKEHTTHLTGPCCVMAKYGRMVALGIVGLSFVCPVIAVQQRRWPSENRLFIYFL